MKNMKTKLAILLLCPMFIFSQNWNWVTNPQININDQNARITINSVCTNANDDIYVTGVIKSSGLYPIDFGNNVSLINASNSGHAYVAKYNAEGIVQWAKVLGTQNNSIYSVGNAICSDKEGNLYITGNYNGPIQFSNGIPDITTLSSASSDIFVIKCDKMGDVIWAKSANQTSGSGVNKGTSIAYDPIKNECVITGLIRMSTTFFSSSLNPISLSTNSTNSTMFIAKFDSDSGEIIWAKAPKSTNGFSLGNSVTTTINGYAVTGMFDGDVDFSLNTILSCQKNWFPVFCSGNSMNMNGSDVFVAKYSFDGDLIWAKKFGGDYTDVSNAISSDNDGNLYFTGGFESTAWFDQTSVKSNSGKQDIFVSKCNSLGDIKWVHSAGGVDQFDKGMGIATNGKGETYVTGSYFGENLFDKSGINSLPFGINACSSIPLLVPVNPCGIPNNPTPWLVPFTGCNNIFITKFDTDGALNFVKSAGEGNSSSGAAICIKNDEKGAIISGYITPSVAPFDQLELKTNGVCGFVGVLEDEFFAKARYANGAAKNINSTDNDILVFPNPFSTSTTIVVPQELKNAELIVYDTFDKKVKQLKNISTKNIQLSSEGLLNGVYFYNVVQDNKMLYKGKFIIE